MVKGDDFEVSKEVYERAKAQYETNTDDTLQKAYYMTSADQQELFSETIRFGYGLYSPMVYEKDGKYICSWYRGSSCD